MWRAALLALTVAGCAAVGPGAPDGAPRPARETIRDFAIEARVAVRNGAESGSANVAWQRTIASDHLLITSALGQGLAELRGGPEGAQLTTADRRHYSASSLDDLAESVFGARLPLSGLADWILGRPGPAVVQAERDEQGRLLRLEEDGWRVEYARYETAGAQALPELLQLKRGEIEVRIRIDRWSLQP
jgi:outer membrane lipoprotein LolB